MKNTCVIEAHICVSDITPKIPQPDQSEQHAEESEDLISEGSNSNSSQTEEAQDQAHDLTLRDLIDVESFGPEEAHFVPLLEEACTWHPSLIQSQKNRSRWFKLWAFTSLGQVLYFLKTKKVRDMNEEGCENLQGLWEELVKSSGFSLNWLEPYVESALSVKGNLGKVEEVERVTQNVADLEIKVKKLKEELDSAQMGYEVATKELVEIKKGFKEMDLNAGLGYAMF